MQDAGDYTLSTTLPSLTIDNTLLTNVTATLTGSGGLSLTADASLPLVNSLHLHGSYSNGQYSLSASASGVEIAGYPLTGAVTTLSDAGIGLSGRVSGLPLLPPTVSFTGTILDSGHYSLSGSVPDFTLNGVNLTNPVVTLSPSGLGISAGVSGLPLTNTTVTLTGFIQDADDYTLSVGFATIPIGPFQLNNAMITLSSTELSLSGSASLPLIGNNIPLTGVIGDSSHYSVSANLGSLDLGGGFSLTTPRVTLSDAGLTLAGHAVLPVVGAADVRGSIQDATHFNLSASPSAKLGIGQFSLSNVTVSLMDEGNGTSLSVSGAVTLPLFKTVTFTGTIDASGALSISTQLPQFSAGGFLTISNDTLTLFTDHIHVQAHVSIANFVDADFSGDILPNGDYELDANVALKIGGFTIPIPTLPNHPDLRLINGTLDVGFDYDIPGLSAFLPSGGNDDGVSFSGSYSLDGQWSLTATASFTFDIGPVVVSSESLTLTPNSLTLSATGSILDLGPLAQGVVSMTIFNDLTFQASVTVSSTVAGFSLGNATVTFGDHNDSKTFIATLHGTVNVGGTVVLDGYWDSTGNYDFKGTANVVLGGLTLAQGQFELNKAQGLTFSGSCNLAVITGTVSGTITPEPGGGFASTSSLTGTILGGPNLNLSGTFDSHGDYDFKGQTDVMLGPLNLSQASFELSNTSGLTFSDAWNLGVFTSTVTGAIQPEGAGYVVSADAKGTVFGQSLELTGDIHSSGRFDLQGYAQVNLGPLSLATANFEFTNKTGAVLFTFGSQWNFEDVFAGNVSAIITGNSNSYDLKVDAYGTVFGQALTGFNLNQSQVSSVLGAAGGVLSSAVGAVSSNFKRATSWGGYTEGGIIFFDTNFTGVFQASDPQGFTDSTGNVVFYIPDSLEPLTDAEGQFVVQGGVDGSTGLPEVAALTAPGSWSAISILTTLVSSLANGDGFTVADAAGQVLLAMGLPANLDLSTFDAIGGTLSGNVNGPAVVAAQSGVEDTIALVAALFRNPYSSPPSASLTGTVEGAIAGLVAQAASALDFTNTSTITSIIQAVEINTGINLGADLVSGAATVIADANQQIAAVPIATDLEYLADVAKVKIVSQGAVANDLASAVAGQTSISTVVTNDTGTSVAATIAGTLTPPVVVVPLNIVAAATSPSGAAVNFSVSAIDLAGETLTPTSDFSSGATFPIGVTTVNSSATDSLGNQASASFTITVADTTAPTLTLPADLAIEANTAGGAQVILPNATATDPVDANPVVTEDHSSGFFGVTTVNVTATDSAGNTSSRSFTVTITDQTPPTINLLANVQVEANTAAPWSPCRKSSLLILLTPTRS